MSFWGICLRVELEEDAESWRIARSFKSEASAKSATSVQQRVIRTERRSDYAGTELSDWRNYWIDGNGQEPGKVYRFDAIASPATLVDAVPAAKKKAKKKKAKKKKAKKKKAKKKKAKKKAGNKGKAPARSGGARSSSKRGKPRSR